MEKKEKEIKYKLFGFYGILTFEGYLTSNSIQYT